MTQQSAGGQREGARPDGDASVGEGLRIPAKWDEVTNLPILFANEIWVRWQDDYFILTFGQVELPYQAEMTDEVFASLDENPVPIRIVARLGVTPTRLANFIGHLTRLYNLWSAAQQPSEQRGEAHDTD